MIDIKHFREHPEEYQISADRRGLKIDTKKILELDGQRLELLGQVEGLRGQLNVKGKPTDTQLKELQQTKEKLEQLESKLTDIAAKLDVAWRAYIQQGGK